MCVFCDFIARRSGAARIGLISRRLASEALRSREFRHAQRMSRTAYSKFPWWLCFLPTFHATAAQDDVAPATMIVCPFVSATTAAAVAVIIRYPSFSNSGDSIDRTRNMVAVSTIGSELTVIKKRKNDTGSFEDKQGWWLGLLASHWGMPENNSVVYMLQQRSVIIYYESNDHLRQESFLFFFLTFGRYVYM